METKNILSKQEAWELKNKEGSDSLNKLDTIDKSLSIILEERYKDKQEIESLRYHNENLIIITITLTFISIVCILYLLKIII